MGRRVPACVYGRAAPGEATAYWHRQERQAARTTWEGKSSRRGGGGVEALVAARWGRECLGGGGGVGCWGEGTLASPWGGAHIIRTRATQASPPPFPTTPAPTGTPLPPKVGAN